MNYTLVSYDEFNEEAERQFNPPAFNEAFTESDFYKEWKSIQKAIKEALLPLGFRSFNEDGDHYTMPDDWGYSRYQGIEINNKKMLDKRLVPTLQELLMRLPHEYEVVIEHDLLDAAPFGIIVRKGGIIAHQEAANILNRFGLDTR